ncbi:MAG TPA: CHAT domain-containing tetratricopeptide repeat protein [Pyrinomonadaceae bacterium]|nr:CHAT domain-containing tetratricopeptide repeat protein [Pyrinomonadaceae bacterium]
MQQPSRVLLPNEALRQTVSGAETHTYQISLVKDQFVGIIVDQRGVDVILTISGGDQGELQVDNPNGAFGIESASVLATNNSTFTITVKTTDANRKGSYDLNVEGPREKIYGDSTRVRAEHIFASAQQARRAGRNQEAIDKYTEAIALWAELGDLQHQAYAFCQIGRIYKAMAEMKQSLAFLERAVEYSRRAGDISGQAFDLNEIGATYRDLESPLPAITNYEQALELRQKLNDRLGEAQLFNNIGLVRAKTGHQLPALENYQKALDLWREAQDSTNWARALNNIAESYSELGDLSRALELFQEALALCQKSGNRSLEGSIRNNLGIIYDTWADSQHALDTYQEALSIFTALNDERGQATVDENIGMVYAGLNDTASANERFQKALVIREHLKEPRGTAIALDHLGFVQGMMGLNQDAIRNLKRSISLSQETRNRAFEAYSLTNLGVSYFSLGDSETALRNYRQALGIQTELDDRRGQAITLDKMGQLFASTSQGSDALASYNDALKLWLSIGDKQGQALTLYGLAQADRRQGKLEDARRQIAEAIDIIESVRSGMSSHQLRLTYFTAKEDLYQLDIDVRMQIGLRNESEKEIASALYTSERSRARNLLDLLSLPRAGKAQTSLLEDRDRSERLSQEMSNLRQSLWRLRAMKQSDDVAFVEEQLSKLARETDENRSRGAFEDHTNLRPLTAPQIQNLLDDDTLLLEYALGAEHSYLWAVTRGRISGYALPGRETIESDVEKFRRAITAYEPKKEFEKSENYIARLRDAAANFREVAQTLSRDVLGPVSAQLGNKRLVVVADGALQYVPFGALPFPDTAALQITRNNLYSPLILNNQIVTEPSASTLILLRNRSYSSPAKAVAVFADPVFDQTDPRVREGSQKPLANPVTVKSHTVLRQTLRDIGEMGTSDEFRLERLKYSADEANAIGALVPSGSSKLALNFEANRNAVFSPDLRQFRIIHFATHGVLNARHPELSGIVLSMVDERGQPQDGFFMLSDIYSLSLPVELVVLSACQTGIGKQVRGEGLVALPRGFLLAGASKVVASLWRVDDEATAELMQRFYRYLLLKNLTVPEALRRAQIDMLQSTDQWRAPYYWAGFVMEGEWK